MDFISILIIVIGLCIFEVITSIDNAIINADVLKTMQPKYRKWFLFWGIIIGVFVIRGLLPWLIIWITTPSISPWQAFVASFSGDSSIQAGIEASAPILLIGGGIYLVFLFLHWIFIEDKEYGLIGERTLHKYGAWFFAITAVILTITVWYALHTNPLIAFGAVVGSTVFFITHGLKQNAEQQEKSLQNNKLSDLSKIIYLEIIDATFSIDSVLGAFAFTLSVPLIIIGNGVGALIVRHLTIQGVDKIKKYMYLKNGAMYSILVLGVIMVLDSLGHHIPTWLSPLTTIVIVGYFFLKSRKVISQEQKQ